jgi:hypothetical protein
MANSRTTLPLLGSVGTTRRNASKLHCPRVRFCAAIVAIEICEFGGEFVTQRKLVGGKPAALHFQRQGRGPNEVVRLFTSIFGAALGSADNTGAA